MRRSVVTGVVGVALAIVATCVPETPPVVLTPPPPPAEADMWPEMVWAATTFGVLPPGATMEMVEGVAGNGDTIVAVGFASNGAEDDGSAWWAGADGVFVRAGGQLEGIRIEDVAVGPGGFVAMGTRSGDPFFGGTTRIAILHSVDGLVWRTVLDGAGAPEGYVAGVGGGPSGFVAVAYPDAAQPGSIVLTSSDGVDWSLVDATVDGGEASIGDPLADGDGWLATGGQRGHNEPSIVRSNDGITWTATRLEGPDTNAQYVDRVLRSPGGYLARGVTGDSCPPGASCVGTAVSWWSADGVAWGRQTGVPREIAGATWAVHPERGFVAMTSSEAWSSVDGWHWVWIGDIGIGEAESMAVVGDRIVAGGWWPQPAGGLPFAELLVGSPAQ
jgi:hypothetical protein